MRIERELMRGAGPVAVLKLLADRREMYGYELIEALDHRSEGVLAMGQSTLYPMLYNLEAKGLIKAQWRAAASGKQRKYYTLTERGRTRLANETRQWNSLARTMAKMGVIDLAAAPAPNGVPA